MIKSRLYAYRQFYWSYFLENNFLFKPVALMEKYYQSLSKRGLVNRR